MTLTGKANVRPSNSAGRGSQLRINSLFSNTKSETSFRGACIEIFRLACSPNKPGIPRFPYPERLHSLESWAPSAFLDKNIFRKFSEIGSCAGFTMNSILDLLPDNVCDIDQ